MPAKRITASWRRIDRIASASLIRRFIASGAVFHFVQSERYAPAADGARLAQGSAIFDALHSYLEAEQR
ncbi:MAG TPA: chromate resistance protein ChrB domain-containing protein [Candidatus Limnocylindrales bacterium]|nr:chromate resistance protein ChrB domain-containing protein [Candidatus Limnocylindrales bacterium]